VSRFFLVAFGVLFAALTAVAGYMTAYDVGVMEPGAKQIRAASPHKGVRTGVGGIRRGK
jgi:hypothetical protein